MILGCFLGAGFVSGREIAFYFGRFGGGAIVSIVIVTVLLFLFILLFLFLSDKFYSFDKFSKFCFGKGAVIINLLVALCLLILSGSMLAGTNALAFELNINNFVLVSITLIITFFIVMGRGNALARINNILVPVLLVVMILVSLNDTIDCVVDIRVKSIVYGINYVLINITTLGVFILEIGHNYSKKEKVIISSLSGCLIGLLLFLVLMAIMGGGLVDEIMPSLSLASRNSVLFVLMQICIYFGLITSFIANVFTLSNYLNNLIDNRVFSILIVLFLSVLVSIIGFVYIVGYVYSIIGVVGLILVIGGVSKQKRMGRAPILKS